MADDDTTPGETTQSETPPRVRRAGVVHEPRVQPVGRRCSPAWASACGDPASCACAAARRRMAHHAGEPAHRTTGAVPRRATWHTQWVRNLRVAGSGELRVGKRTEPFRATEVADADKVAILRAYLKRWKAEVGVFFDGVSADSPDADLQRISPDHPVFRLDIAAR